MLYHLSFRVVDEKGERVIHPKACDQQENGFCTGHEEAEVL